MRYIQTQISRELDQELSSLLDDFQEVVNTVNTKRTIVCGSRIQLRLDRMKNQKSKVSGLMVRGEFYIPIDDLGITKDETQEGGFPNNLTDKQQDDLWGRIFYPHNYDLDWDRYEGKWSCFPCDEKMEEVWDSLDMMSDPFQ